MVLSRAASVVISGRWEVGQKATFLLVVTRHVVTSLQTGRRLRLQVRERSEPKGPGGPPAAPSQRGDGRSSRGDSGLRPGATPREGRRHRKAPEARPKGERGPAASAEGRAAGRGGGCVAVGGPRAASTGSALSSGPGSALGRAAQLEKVNKAGRPGRRAGQPCAGKRVAQSLGPARASKRGRAAGLPGAGLARGESGRQGEAASASRGRTGSQRAGFSSRAADPPPPGPVGSPCSRAPRGPPPSRRLCPRPPGWLRAALAQRSPL